MRRVRQERPGCRILGGNHSQGYARAELEPKSVSLNFARKRLHSPLAGSGSAAETMFFVLTSFYLQLQKLVRRVAFSMEK